jgi:hypothetical protein
MVILAVGRLRLAMDSLTDGVSAGAGVSVPVLAEVHEATMSLMWLTGTTDLTSAIAAAGSLN